MADCVGGLVALLRLFVYFRIDVTNTFIDLEYQSPFAAGETFKKKILHHDFPELLKMYLWYSFIENSCK